MKACATTSLADRQADRSRADLDVADDLLLVHGKTDISTYADAQAHKCRSQPNSIFAKSLDVEGLAEDTALVRAIAEWSGITPSRMAVDIGLAATTLARPASGKATTRIGRKTLDALRARFPDFPGFASASVPPTNAIPVQFEGASEERLRDDLPVYGTALGAVREIDGEAIEQTTLNRAEIIQFARRPVILNGNAAAYGLYVAGSSMDPRYRDGEMILVDPKGRFRGGDDVVVYLRPVNQDDDDGDTARAALVKTFVRRTATYVELEQYQPAKTFRVDTIDVLKIERILTITELIS